MKNANLTGLIYVINSECSSCIGKFLDFIFHYKKSDNKLPIIAIIEVGTKEALIYHMEQTKLNTDIDLYLYENIDYKYVAEKLDKQNGRIFYLYKGTVINSFLYESLF